MTIDVGVKKADCKFYVDEEKRTVVCVIPNTRDKLVDFIDHNTEEYGVFGSIYGKLILPTRFTGKAVCSENDVWSADIGMDLAFMRAKDKFYKSFFKRAQLYITEVERNLSNLCDMFNSIGEKVSEKMANLKEDLEEQIGD